MADHIAAGARLPKDLCGNAEPARRSADPVPGLCSLGAMVGIAFGQVSHLTLGRLAGCGEAVRMTPWRMLLVEGMREMPDGADFITRTDDPVLRVIACSGASRCGEAHADTRTLASMLAPLIPADVRLHVSGCAKGCAHSGSADITLVATREGFDVIQNGSTRDLPAMRGLSRADIVANPSVLWGGG
jgi:precorrin-3B synthase